ncbi:MAG: TolC family protein, partial [Candidatus Acidiferrales bacterium]
MFRNRRTRHLIFFLAVLLTLLASAPGLSRAQTQSHFSGSVPTGQATGTVLRLSLHDAFDRALKYNLGAIESDQDTRAAHAVRLRSLNALLPNLSARVSASLEQINFKAQGLNISIPGVAIPIVVGPFGVTDARAYLSQEIFNWSDIQGWKSAAESETASRYTYQSDRDLVVFTAGDAYLLVLSDLATVDSTRAQVTTAQTLYQQDADRNKHGLVASIDVLRAQVELQTEQQRLIAAENQLAIDKLSLARVI